MIEVCIGPYRSGKTGRLLRELIDYKRDNPLAECLILVPSHRYGRLLRQHLHELLKASSSCGIFGVQIATVAQACQQIMKAAGAAVQVLPQDLCVRAVSDVLMRMQGAGQLSHLQSICELPGTAGALYRLIEEFERAALPPSEVLRAVQSTAADAARHQELARIYQRYWERLDELGCLDQKRLALSSRELLVKKQVPGLHLRWLIVDGFDRISPLQAEIIEGLSRHAAQTRIAFDYVLPEQRLRLDPQDDEYSWKDSSYDELQKRFQVKPECLGVPGDGTRPRQFAFSTLDLFAEMQETVRRCKEAVCVRGIKPGQILVVARDLDSYACAARLAFNQAGLPIFVDQARELAGVPWMKVVLQLFRLSLDDWPRRAVIDLLRSKYVNTDAFGIKAADIDRFDKRSREAAVIGSGQQWLAAFPPAEQLGGSLTKLLAALTPPPVQTMRGYCLWLEDTIETVLVRFSTRPSISHGHKPAEKTLQPDEAELQAVRGLRGVIGTLLTEESLFGAEQLSYGQFFKRFQQLLEAGNFRLEEPPVDHVYICSAEHAPNRRYDEVFLVGAVEGQFPRHSGESGFVSADERARWEMFGVKLPNPREQVGYEKALFRSLIERARKSFWLSFPQVDLNGDEIIESFYLSDGTVDHGAVEKIDSSRAALFQPTAAREAVFGWLWRQPGYTLTESMLNQQEIEEYWRQINPCVYGAYQRHQGNVSDAYNGDLTALVDSGWLQYKLPVAWSASALNNYGQCPFKFWLSNMLRVEPPEEPDTGLDSKARGKLYHHVLELYYREMITATSGSPSPANSKPQSETSGETINEQVLQAALTKAFHKVELGDTFRAGPYWDNEKKEIAFRARRFLEYDRLRCAKNPLVSPALLETKFGLFDGSSPALKIQTALGEVAIRGVIDRIDVETSENGTVCGATVIDYKLGSTPVSLDEARAGANLQVPVYALAVEKVIMPGVRVKSGLYLGINGAKSNGAINMEKEPDILPNAQAKIAQMIESIASGSFPVKPFSSKTCDSCPHDSLCRIADLKQAAEAED